MLINGDIRFEAKLLEHKYAEKSEDLSWYGLELYFSQRCDTVTSSSKIVLNTVTKQDMLNLSEYFRDLAGKLSVGDSN